MKWNFDERLHELFDTILTWHDGLVDGRRFFKIHVPVRADWPAVPEIAFGNRKLLTSISTNIYNDHPLELYSTRRDSVRFFDQRLGDQFDVYGLHWNEARTRLQKLARWTTPHIHSYRGLAMDKANTLAGYRFSLAYENAAIPGWITEKIFDSMRSGCVPVYLGAPNIDKYVDPDAFIDRSRFSSDAEVANYLASVDEQQFRRYQEAMADYLQSERFRAFTGSQFADRISATLDDREAPTAS
jgi:hypothetical protein